MQRPKTLQAFTESERQRVHSLLAANVAFMMGRKLEEADWSSAYCRAKNIPERGWSNLDIDVAHEGLGVEHKMLSRVPNKPIMAWSGQTLMHPSLTRKIRISSIDSSPEKVKAESLEQYADLVAKQLTALRSDAPDGQSADLRAGWMLWQTSLREFLYFEQEILVPNPKDYTAQWEERPANKSRKGSRNLWIYEKDLGAKRFSVTTVAGAKIQPYFDVPPPTDPNLYFFKVQGEEISPGKPRRCCSR